MPLNTIPLPFGLREVKVTPYTDDAATTLGSPVKLPYGRTLTFAEVETFEDLRGDDQLVASHGSGPNVEWQLESGGVSLEAGAVIYGGLVTTTGVTPNQIKKWEKYAIGSGSTRPYFKIEGRSISDSGGDVHIVINRAKATDNMTGEFADGSFFLFGASGKGYGSNVLADANRVWAIVQNETATAIA